MQKTKEVTGPQLVWNIYKDEETKPKLLEAVQYYFDNMESFRSHMNLINQGASIEYSFAKHKFNLESFRNLRTIDDEQRAKADYLIYTINQIAYMLFPGGPQINEMMDCSAFLKGKALENTSLEVTEFLKTGAKAYPACDSIAHYFNLIRDGKLENPSEKPKTEKKRSLTSDKYPEKKVKKKPAPSVLETNEHTQSEVNETIETIDSSETPPTFSIYNLANWKYLTSWFGESED